MNRFLGVWFIRASLADFRIHHATCRQPALDYKYCEAHWDSFFDNDVVDSLFEHCVPCDTELAYYITARHLDCMGFGDGTAADMQLGPLLFLQVSAVCLI